MNTSDKLDAIILFGANGSGKGTGLSGALSQLPREQAQGHHLYADQFVHYSSGDEFRKDPRFVQLMASGALVPDEYVKKMLQRDFQAYRATRKFIPGYHIAVLDGVPRKPSQIPMVGELFNIISMHYLDLAAAGDPCPLIEERAAQRTKEREAFCAELYLYGSEPTDDQLPRKDDMPGVPTKRYKGFERDTVPTIFDMEKLGIPLYVQDATAAKEIVAETLRHQFYDALLRRKVGGEGRKRGLGIPAYVQT